MRIMAQCNGGQTQRRAALQRAILRALYAEPLALEIGIGFFALVLGLSWLAPSNTFGVSDVYRMLASVASESFWGALLIVSGVSRIACAMAGTIRWRRIMSALGMFGWLFLGLSFYASNPAGSFWWIAGALAVKSTWVAWRLRQRLPEAR